jgi:hypothetical protein
MINAYSWNSLQFLYRQIDGASMNDWDLANPFELLLSPGTSRALAHGNHPCDSAEYVPTLFDEFWLGNGFVKENDWGKFTHQSAKGYCQVKGGEM